MKKINFVASFCCLILLLVNINQAIAAAGQESTQKPMVTQESLLAAKIDINNADEKMLTNLPGVGPTTASRIHEYRKVNGPFKSVDDLLKVKGIGPKVLDKIRPFVTIT